MSFIENILKILFSIKNIDSHKIITILGIKLKFIRQDYKIRQALEHYFYENYSSIEKLFLNLNLQVNQINQNFKEENEFKYRLYLASVINHMAFLKYKGCFRNKTVVLVAAGPTANFFNPIDDAIYVGCNRAFLLNKINFDFLFAIDKVGISDYYEEFFRYKENTCIKFIGDQNLGKNFQIPENYIPISDKIFRYITSGGINVKWEYPLDISVSPLLNPPTVSLQALQFILWTQPQKIYIVGVDCTCATEKHFDGKATDCSFRNENIANNDKISIDSYKMIKDFALTYYPQTEIISVNPVGLKGIFNDVYTKLYVNKNENLIDELGDNLKFLEE